MRYRREIDGLRALAVLPVIFFHAGFRQFGGGFTGVDVFFVISGYLITSIILAETMAGSFSLLRFYERRARRILPALYLVMGTSVVAAWVFLAPFSGRDFYQSLAATALFSSNILFVIEAENYFALISEYKPLLHTWSLALEEQFYVVFPIFLVLAWRLGRRRAMALSAVLALVSLSAAQWGSMAWPAATFYLLPTRGWELLIGALIALYLAGRDAVEVSPAVRRFGSLLGLLMIAYGVVAFDKATPYPSLYALAPTLGTALIILFATPQTEVGKLLGSKLLVGVGLVSYSAYLWHQPLFAFARHISMSEPGGVTLSGLAVLSFLLAYVSWRFV